jgi:hypothetical protein
MGFNLKNMFRKNTGSIDDIDADGNLKQAPIRKQRAPACCQASYDIVEKLGVDKEGKEIINTVSYCVGMPAGMNKFTLGVEPDLCACRSEQKISESLNEKALNYSDLLKTYGNFHKCN